TREAKAAVAADLPPPALAPVGQGRARRPAVGHLPQLCLPGLVFFPAASQKEGPIRAEGKRADRDPGLDSRTEWPACLSIQDSHLPAVWRGDGGTGARGPGQPK